MKFNAGNSVLLGNVLGSIDDTTDGASSKKFYNNWNDRQERFASQFNSSSQLHNQFPISNPHPSSLPNHNNQVFSKKDISKGVSQSLHNSSSTGSSILDYHATRKKVESYYQIPTMNAGECKICVINKSLCSICLQKQSKMQRPFLNPKGSESFSTNIPLYRKQHFGELDNHQNNYLTNSSVRDSIKQLSLSKRSESKKQQIGIDQINKNVNNYSFSINKQDSLKLKFIRHAPNSSQKLSQSFLSTGTGDNQKGANMNLDKIHPSTTGKKDSGRKQYFSQHQQQINEDEQILTDNYMKYILRIRQDEIDNPELSQNQAINQNDYQTNFQSAAMNQINHSDKNNFMNLFPIVLDQHSNSSKKNQNLNQLNPNNIQINGQNQVKVLDLNNLLSKQKSCSQYVNSQLIVDANQIKPKNLMNITHINFGGRNDLSSKKKLENEFYQKNQSDNKINKELLIPQSQILATTTQAIQAMQKSLKKPKKSIIYSKVKTQNLQNSFSINNNVNHMNNENVLLQSPRNKTIDNDIIKATFPDEHIDNTSEQSEQKFQQYLSYIGRNNNNNPEFKSNKKLLKSNLMDNEDILDEQSEVSDQIEEEYQNNQMVSGKKKNIADQLQKYVRNLKNKVLIQNHKQKGEFNTSNHNEKENKRFAVIEPSEIKISSLAQKSSDQNIFNFKYRKTLLKAQTNFNTSNVNQSIELDEQDSIQQFTTESTKDQQQILSFDNKLLNQDSTSSLDALPISFPKLHRPFIKKHILTNQRNDLQLNAQRINVANRQDRQQFSSGKESFYETLSNKKQNEKSISYSLSSSKHNKILQNSLPLSSNKQVKTEPGTNEMENNYRSGIQINSYVNKNRISLQDISFQNTIDQNSNKNQQLTKEDLSQLIYEDNTIQDFDLCEWKNSPTQQLQQYDEQLLIEKTQIGFEEIVIQKQTKKKNKKIIKVKNQYPIQKEN